MLDNGGLELMSWPYRDYSMYLGRWYQAEKLGMILVPGSRGSFAPKRQYEGGLNYYGAFDSNPVGNVDPAGLLTLATKIEAIFATRLLTWCLLNHLIRGNHYDLNDSEQEMNNAPFWQWPMKDCYAEVIRRNRPIFNNRCTTIQFYQGRCPGAWQMASTSLFDSAWWLGGAHWVSASGSFKACCPNGGPNCKVWERDVDWEWHDDIDAHSFIESATAYVGTGNWLDQILTILGVTVEGLWDIYGDKIGDTDFRVTVHWKDPQNPEVITVGL